MRARARWWMGIGAAVALGACWQERTSAPASGAATDTSEMGRAGLPLHQGATPSGHTGEGQGFPGEQSAVRELPPGVPINTGIPGGKRPEPPAPAPERK